MKLNIEKIAFKCSYRLIMWITAISFLTLFICNYVITKSCKYNGGSLYTLIAYSHTYIMCIVFYNIFLNYVYLKISRFIGN